MSSHQLYAWDLEAHHLPGSLASQVDAPITISVNDFVRRSVRSITSNFDFLHDSVHRVDNHHIGTVIIVTIENHPDGLTLVQGMLPGLAITVVAEACATKIYEQEDDHERH